MQKKHILLIHFLLLFMAAKASAQDWPNLNRYKSENSVLLKNNSNNRRIVLMGDSITEGWSAIDPDFFVGKPYINRGISGQTSPQMLLRFRSDVITLHPEVVVLLAGTNDIAGNTGVSTIEMIIDNLISMCELAKANQIKVILCTVLPVYDYPWKTGLAPVQKIIALNAKIKQYAKEQDIVNVDYFSAMVDDRQGLKSIYSKDGVHPNKMGYQQMGPLLENALQALLK
jgi:lysophospholipase L1-like esterase